MENLVKELKTLVRFKQTTEPGDIVLIAAKEPQMLLYAYVKDIERDDTRKDEWWHLSITVLSLPLQDMTWTLRTPQMTGEEIFTMGGEERFVQAIDLDAPAAHPLARKDGVDEKEEKSTDKKQEGFIKRIK